MELIMTWNLVATPVVTAVASSIIIAVVNRQFKRRDAKDAKIAELIRERDEKRDTRVDTELSRIHGRLCQITDNFNNMALAMTTKVGMEYCKKQEAELHKRITDHITSHTREVSR